jgi:hypothetical protein
LTPSNCRSERRCGCGSTVIVRDPSFEFTSGFCRLLAVRFGPLTAEVETQLRSASISELDAIGERLLTAPTLQEALGQH